MKKVAIIISLGVVLSVLGMAVAQSSGGSLDNFMVKYIYNKFKNTACFLPSLWLTDKTGLNQEALEDYFEAELQSDLPQIVKCGGGDAAVESPVLVSVWTVGTSYPVAFYVDIEADAPGEVDTYHDARLGYTSSTRLLGIVQDAIDRLVDGFVIAFLKGRAVAP